jgi:hypothetical protein
MSFDRMSPSKYCLGPWDITAAKTPGDVELNMGLLLPSICSMESSVCQRRCVMEVISSSSLLISAVDLERLF